ncbi:MAG: hypothetical protein ABIG84_06825 [archaeon]
MARPYMLYIDPVSFGIELTYTLIVVVLCFLVYYRTREIYDLTGYKGIKYFRYAFLFFGLAYASRLFLYVFLISNIALDLIVPMRTLLPVSSMVVAYLSTMALLYMAYTTIWKRLNFEHFLHLSSIIALIVAGLAFASRSPVLVSLVQLLILLFIIVISAMKQEKGKKLLPMRAVYYLVSVFWLINLFVLDPMRFLPIELKVILQIISVAVFLLIYHKVTKWVK